MSKKLVTVIMSVVAVLSFSACGTKENMSEISQSETWVENVSENGTEEDTDVETQEFEESLAPSKDEVLAMREIVLEGMSDDEIERLTENIKVANSRLESAYLYDNIFDKLSDKDSLYWNYFDEKGYIQIGWSYDGSYNDMKAIMEEEGISQNEFYEKYGEPVTDYNRFDADNFINLIQEMQETVHNEQLVADLQQLIDLTYIASVTHEMEYANQIYKILHDMDYFLLRYGIEDVGAYTQDWGTISKYYDVLTVYGATPYKLDETNSYNVLYQENIESDWEEYGEMETIHEDFKGTDGNVSYYYDMQCFYFDDTYPTVLNETLKAYYDSVEEEYIQTAQIYDTSCEENDNIPFQSLIFQYFTYIDEDYVSLVYNNVSYMGGAHPYSALKGITIDCVTGEVVSVQQFLDDSDEKIGEQLQAVLGMDSASMDGWDYYLTKTSVVFFYYDPHFWDSVETRRMR